MNRSKIIPLFLLPLALFSCASPQVASSSTGKSEPSITVSSTDKTGSQPSSVASADQSILVKEITLNKTSITLQAGQNFALVATISPANATNKKLVFSSSNKKVATVSRDGRISAVSEGDSIILVASEDGNANASCYVHVEGSVAASSISPATQEILVQEITLNETSVTLQEGESFDLVATISPANATNKKLVFTSSNTEAVTVSQDGRIFAASAGYSLVIVLSEDGNASASCYVRVQGIVAVSGVKLNKSSATLEEGKTLQLYETVSPSDANNKQVSWTSSNPNVADVSSSGLVSALSVGKATITVTTADGGFTATCAISVVEKENFSYVVGDTAFSLYTKTSTYSSSTYLHIVTPITNTGNVNIYLNSASYDIYDANENPLMSINQYYSKETPSILAPGETGYFTIDKTYDSEVLTGLKIVDHITITNAKNYKTKRYTLSNISFSIDNYGYLKATGKVKNETDEEGSTIDSIHIVLFDQNGNYLNTLSCLLPAELATGQEAIFQATTLYLCDIADVSQIGNYVACGEFRQLVL
ncbi:MAG: Ig domain-containing protein [Bacilli bacterium]|nr:Ig domain-containing protein [Bacilli bacterium]